MLFASTNLIHSISDDVDNLRFHRLKYLYKMERLLFQFEDLQIEYAEFGTGEAVVFALHGFGREAEDFRLFLPMLREGERIIAINLFQHAGSKWPANRALTDSLSPQEHEKIMSAFAKHLNIETFSLLGYSLGGKVALMTYELMPKMVDQILLIAPDGLKINRFYRFLVNTSIGRSMYRKIMHQPNVLFKTADFAKSAKIINGKLHRFVYVHMDSFEKRKLVYETWLIYRNFIPNLSEIAVQANEHKTPLKLILGTHDSVIKVKDGRRFATQLKRKDALIELKSGHQLLTKETVTFIVENNIWIS